MNAINPKKTIPRILQIRQYYRRKTMNMKTSIHYERLNKSPTMIVQKTLRKSARLNNNHYIRIISDLFNWMN